MLEKKKHPALTKSRVHTPSFFFLFFIAVRSCKLCKNDSRSEEKDFHAKGQTAINASADNQQAERASVVHHKTVVAVGRKPGERLEQPIKECTFLFLLLLLCAEYNMGGGKLLLS